jgi:N-acetylglucosaminyl-diphospho-decaprenol L-rhamnosyltransferase
MRDLAIIIVNWNVRPLLRRCLESIFTHAPEYLDTQVVVVDNASTDGSAQMVAQDFPHVQLIANQANVGFTRGNNQGLRWLGFGDHRAGIPVEQEAAAGRPVEVRPRYVLLLNPDTEVTAGALAALVDFMDRHADVGIAGPQLLFPDGKVQSSRRRFPTLLTAFLESTVLEQWWPDNPMARRYRVMDCAADVVQDVDWIVGAAMFVRREAIASAGLLDEGFFMYSEELDWCRRIKDNGWRVVYLPAARIVHHEGKSSEQVVVARHIHFQRSKVRYFRKHHGPLAAGLLRAFLLAAYTYQLGLEAGKWLVGHHRPLRRERVAAYWQVLRSGL